MFPDSLHLLCVVVHVALQPDALWSTLQHQVRGRCTWRQQTHVNTQSEQQKIKMFSVQLKQPHVGPNQPFAWCTCQLIKLTSDLGDGIDDVFKHCKERKTQNPLKQIYYKNEVTNIFLNSEKVPWPEMSNTDVSFPLSSLSTALKTPWSFLENWKNTH